MYSVYKKVDDALYISYITFANSICQNLSNSHFISKIKTQISPVGGEKNYQFRFVNGVVEGTARGKGGDCTPQ